MLVTADLPHGRWRLAVASVVCVAFLIPATTASAQQIPQVCPDGTIAIGTACPLPPPPVTQAMSGSVPPGSTTTTKCASNSDFVYRLIRHLELANSYTRGVMASCMRPDGSVYNLAVVGQTSSTGSQSVCPSGTVAAGIYGRVGAVVDGFGVACKSNLSSTSTTLGFYMGGLGGAAQGPFACPIGMRLVGVAGGGALYGGGFNVTRFNGLCANPPTFGAANRSTSYRASGSRGPVRFRMIVSRAKADPASWNYGMYGLVVATGCSRSTHVPGGIVVSDRRERSRRSRFSVRRGGFRIKGQVFGSLAKPHVHATVKVLKGACRGEEVEFTARPR